MYNNTLLWVSKCILGCLLFSFYLFTWATIIPLIWVPPQIVFQGQVSLLSYFRSQSLSSIHCLQKTAILRSPSSPVRGTERFSCEDPTPYSLNPFLFFSLFSPCGKDSLPSVAQAVFLSPSLLPCTLHLSHCLPPTVAEFLLLVLSRCPRCSK